MRHSVLTVAAAAIVGAMALFAVVETQAASWPATEISVTAFDEVAFIEEVTVSPSIGRIVHFTPSEACAEKHGPDPVPAMITRVHSPSCVNLKVFWDDDEIERVTSVALDESDEPQPYSWRWPERVA